MLPDGLPAFDFAEQFAQLGIMAWPLAGCSIAALAIGIERLVFILNATKAAETRYERLAAYLREIKVQPKPVRDEMVGVMLNDLQRPYYSGIKSLSEKIGAFFVQTAVEDFGPSEWRIFTRKESTRLLVLIKVPRLRKSVKGSRLVLLNAADKFLRRLGHRESGCDITFEGWIEVFPLLLRCRKELQDFHIWHVWRMAVEDV